MHTLRAFSDRLSRSFLKLPSIPAFLLAASFVFAIVPGDLRENDPISLALYHSESFQGNSAVVPNPPVEARTKLLALIQNDPSNGNAFKAVADVEIQLLDLDSAEIHMKQYLEGASNKSQAYTDLQNFYNSRLRFKDALQAMEKHAEALTPSDSDITERKGRYEIYHLILDQIERYRLQEDPNKYYDAMLASYPKSREVFLEYIHYLRNKDEKKAALEVLDGFKLAFPDDAAQYLQTKAGLLSPNEALALLNQTYSPLWNMELVRLLDQSMLDAGTKGEYLLNLKSRLSSNPTDFDAVTRLFYAFYLSGNTLEAQNALNDFLLLKEKQVITKQSAWSSNDLYVMARLNQLILNYNEAARYYYSLYTLLRSKPADSSSAVQPDAALQGLFQILLAAEERPVQIGAGSLDYYKDIAAMDQNPGILNGILSLILNGTEPLGEFDAQQDKALGYFNRAQAFRIVQFTQKNFPESKHLPPMLRDSLRIFDRYGQSGLIVEVGQQFFKQYSDSKEILEVGLAVADAYARLDERKNEWATYDFLLPIAAKRTDGSLIAVPTQNESGEGSRIAGAANSSTITYQSILNRYITSLTQQKNYTAVVALYRDQIRQYPDEEALYEAFSEYLAQNQLLQDEEELYRQAIQRFQEKGWYEKLARWYLRQQRDQEYEEVSKQIIDLFNGTEVQAYLQGIPSANPYETLYLGLNRYAHQRFPYNVQFVQNILWYYKDNKMWADWESLASGYYFLDPTIRDAYLQYRAKNGTLPQGVDVHNAIDQRLAGDVQVWRSHFEKALPFYEKLAGSYTSDRSINLQLADLKRSLGVDNSAYYPESAEIREHLAQIEPTDASLWTTAGETFADLEQYDLAKNAWQRILAIDPYNPERYLEVATILWDYYLFDDALATIETIRQLKKDPNLFAYEAGAIQESKRNYEKAIAEYAKSLIEPSDLARNRLSELYQRKTLHSVIQKYLSQQLQNNSDNTKWWIGVIQFYSAEKEKNLVKGLLANSLERLNKESFRKISPQLRQTAQDFGFIDFQDQLIQKQIALAQADSERLSYFLELARFYESQDSKLKAELIYRKLYQEQPRSAGIINDLLSYYWRTENYAKAFDLYRQVLQVANADFRKQYQLQYARKSLERKDYGNALASARELLKTDPLNAEYFQLISEIYAEQKDYAGLTEHYKNGLQAVRESQLPQDQKKQRIASFRRGIIQADMILNDYAAALDQYIELINQDPESQILLTEVAEFSSRHNVLDRLLNYYRKTADASPKDHRWPMILGKLFIFSGQFSSATTEFQKAISIHPERTDFHQQLAECYQRLGNYPQAIQTYEELYLLTYKSKQWLTPLSELYARTGNLQKALDLFSQTLERLTPMQVDFALCSKALEWGAAKEAATYGKSGLQKYSQDMNQELESFGLSAYIESQVKTGAEVTAYRELIQLLNQVEKATKKATFDTEILRSADYITKDQITNAFPQLLRKYLTAERYETLQNAIFAEILRSGGYDKNKERIQNIYLPMTRAAGMAPAEEQLLKELAAAYFKAGLRGGLDSQPWSNYHSLREQLRTFYVNRFAFEKLAQWLEIQQTATPANWKNPQELADIAEFYRLAENQQKELLILRKYYPLILKPDVQLQPHPIERYLQLLSSLHLDSELKEAARSADITAANYFIKRKNKELALIAIQSLAKRLSTDPVWRTLNEAMLGWQFREASGYFNEQYRVSLDLRSIGEQLQEHPIQGQSVFGDNWFYFGKKYGEYLWWTDRKSESLFFLNSDLEGAPTNPERQNHLVEFYFQEADLPAALRHADLELQLDPTNASYLDDRARALAELGRKEEAIALWKSMISSQQNIYSYELVLDASVDYGFFDSIQPDLVHFLSDQIQSSGMTRIGNLMPSFLQHVSQQQVSSLLNKWIPSAPSPKEFGTELLGMEALDANDRVEIYKLVSNYLTTWMQSSGGTELEQVRNDWASWNQHYAQELLESKQYDTALQVIDETLQRGGFNKQDDKASPSRWELLQLQKALILIRSGKKQPALKVLEGLLGPSDQATDTTVPVDRYQRVYSLLEAEGLKTEAQDILKEKYERLLLAGQSESANYLGLAEVLIQKRQTGEAKTVLNRMIFLNGENLEGMESAAALFEKHQLFSEAIGYRTDLEKRISWNYTNKSLLAGDLLKIENSKDAAILAAKVLESNLSTAEDRVRAAKVYGKAGKGLIGPLEMQQIERVLRPNLGPRPAARGPYEQQLRAVVIELNSSDVKLLLAQIYIDPENQDLQIQLFQVFFTNKKWELALNVLDPDNERENEYHSNPREDLFTFLSGIETSEDYEDYGASYLPIEKLGLDEEETRQIALKMAECAGKTDDLTGQLFFLNMALDHTTQNEAKAELQKQIDQVSETLAEKQTEEENRYKIAKNLGRQA